MFSGKDEWVALTPPFSRKTSESRKRLRAVLAGGKKAGLLCSCAFNSLAESHSGKIDNARCFRLSANLPKGSCLMKHYHVDK